MAVTFIISPIVLAVLAIIIGTLVVAYVRKIAMTYALIIANFIIFILTLFYTNEVYYELGFEPVYLINNYPMLYTVFTSMFVHGGLLHIFGNMIVLFFVGIAFEQRIGWKKFLLIYFLAGICGTLTYAVFNLDSPTRYITLIGASGAIFGIMGAFAYAYPRDEVLMPVPLGIIMVIRRIKVIYAVVIFAVLETIIVFIDVPNDTTAHLAHIGGLLGGIILSALLLRNSRSPTNQPYQTISYDSYAPPKSGHINFGELEKLASTPEEHQMLDRVKTETIPQVRDAWIERFLEKIKCPKCGNPLHSFEGKIWCDSCGFKTKY
jgi:membrane associated rhomboid family serine protease